MTFHREVSLLVTAALVICIIYSSISPQVKATYSARVKKESSTASTQFSSVCKVSSMNPWDPSIVKYYKKLKPLECSQSQYNLTILLSNGTILVDQKEKSKLAYDITCNYRCFDKVLLDDITLNFTNWVKFKDSIDTNCEFVEVVCKKDSFFSPIVYFNNHNRIIPKEISNSNKTKFSVVLFVMDSVSHSHWKRSLPKTFEVLKSKYGSIVFDGMTKVGDNSFPNAVAMLSGLKSSTEFGSIIGFYDDHPLIWRDFRRQGYTTYYAEDYPNYNLFYYLAKGFKEKPVDHYFRPFWLNVYGSYLHRRSTNLCYGNVPMHRFQLNYFTEFINKNIFALNWLTELGHDYMNQVQWGDQDISEVFDQNYENLKNTFLFVLSDHGHRFDDIRETIVGRKEEQLPFFSLHLPERLVKEYPEVAKIVGENAHKLTSFWDFHTTLQDILHLSETGNWKELEEVRQSLEIEKKMRKYSKRGISLLRPLPERSCQEAEIPDEYCTCKHETSIDTNSSKVELSAAHMMKQINAQIAPFAQCSPLTLSRIVDAYHEDGSMDLLRIILEAKPSGALFEGLLRRTTNDREVVGDISRVNRYGNQSLCVDNPTIRKFCFCLSPA